MKWEVRIGANEHRAHPRGYRLRVGWGYDELTGKRTNTFWNVESCNRHGHVKVVAQGWAKTIKEAKRLAEGFAEVHAGKEWVTP